MRRLLAAVVLVLAALPAAATDLYFSRRNTWVSPITPAIDGGWEDFDEMQRGLLSPVYAGTSDHWQGLAWVGSGQQVDLAVSTSNQEIDRQSISPPMAAGVVFTSGSTLVSMQAAMSEEETADNVTQCILGVRIIDSDGSTVVATLLTVGNYGTTTEIDQNNYGTVYIVNSRNKTCANGDAVGQSYTTTGGEFLVVETGFATSGATDADPQAWMHYADNGGVLFNGAANSMCPVNETTAQCIAYIAFSNSITFLDDPEPGPTRLYLPLDTTVPCATPAISNTTNGNPSTAFWEVSEDLVRRALVPVKGGSTTTEVGSFDVEDLSGSATSEIFRQYISPPMHEGVTFTALRTRVRAQIRAREGQNVDDLVLIGGVRVYSQDGTTLRATLIPVDMHWQANSDGNGSNTSQTNELKLSATNESVFATGDGALVQETWSAVAGDRLVYEIGVYQRTVAQLGDVWWTFGESASDCDEDDSVDTASCSPWIEFSNDITFQSEVACPTFLPRPHYFGRLL